MKKVVSIIISMVFIFSSTSIIFAETDPNVIEENSIENTSGTTVGTENIFESDSTSDKEISGIKPAITRKWSISSSSYVGIVNVGSRVFYDKEQANASGERITMTVTKKYSGTISGELKVTLSALEAKLGFNYLKEFTVSKSKTSKALSKGETVYTYYQKRNKKYKVVQKGTRTGLEPIYRTVYVYKPFAPTITMEYK